MKGKAFTLMELMIVIVIIGILAAVGMVIFSNVALKSKITCATANHQKIFETLSSRIKICNAGMSVTYGPFCVTGCSPKTRTLNCTVTPSSYAHPHPADSHAWQMYLEAKLGFKSCYDNKISAFGGTTSSGHGWSSGAGFSNGTCSGIKDSGIKLGQSVLGYQGHPAQCSSRGDIACLKTNVGDKDGNDAFLKSEMNLCLF